MRLNRARKLGLVFSLQQKKKQASESLPTSFLFEVEGSRNFIAFWKDFGAVQAGGKSTELFTWERKNKSGKITGKRRVRRRFRKFISDEIRNCLFIHITRDSPLFFVCFHFSLCLIKLICSGNLRCSLCLNRFASKN